MARKRRKVGPIVGWILLVVLIFVTGYFVRFYLEIGRLARRNPSTTALIEMRRLERGDKGARAPLPNHWHPLSQISPNLQHAVVVAEDARFYQHRGFDWNAILEAAGRDWEAKSFEYGGSTITQQLAKNLYLSPDKNFFRKVKEALITSALETRLSKRRILEVYLNVVEWGDQIYGAEAASRDYFGKPAAALTPEEAAFLAAILPAPRYYHRHRTTPYIRKRSEVILREMKRRYPESGPERENGFEETSQSERRS
ncbi:MAG: monofunctional biosynthetic peptidoglycan transglycosylase [Nitrospirae bacterium]|nr:monofunctional biosynthetic peptidoglycan transglycosylase [Candidatus Manganitrophaceae bacterium]